MYQILGPSKGQNSKLSGHREVSEHNVFLKHTFNEPMKGSFIHGYSKCLFNIDACPYYSV